MRFVSTFTLSVLLNLAMLSNVFALSITNNNNTDGPIEVKIFYPKTGTSDTGKESCWKADEGDATIAHRILTFNHGKTISTGISGDRPKQRVCIVVGAWWKKQQYTSTNPIWDVQDCKITFHRIESGSKAWVTATPACEFTCITTDANGNCTQ